MTSYNHLRKMGMDPRNAAQTAALYHGDYAAVPRNTRVALNKVLYTPTFKIAMAKLHGRLIKSSLGMGDVKYANLGRKAAMGSIGTIALTNLAFDMFFTEGLGFDRESWGRRYSKEVETEDGTKRFNVTLSHPQNLVPKYYDKVAKIFGTTEPGKIKRAINALNLEMTPALSIVAQMVMNDAGMGRVIYNNYDDDHVKLRKSAAHTLRRLSSYFKTAYPTDGDRKVKEAFRKEVGLVLATVLNTISYQYLGRTKEERLMGRLNRAKRNIEQDIYRELNRDVVDDNAINSIFDNFMRDIDDALE
ncbi:MAG: hypothetical protein ACXABY_28960, partial [Candidatus Thorarchaeota archaeon]|jgi:hypothetical protein